MFQIFKPFKKGNPFKKVIQFFKLEYSRLVELCKQFSKFTHLKYIQCLEYITQLLMMWSYSMMQCLLKLKKNDMASMEKFADQFAVATTQLLHDIIVAKGKNPKTLLQEFEYQQLSNCFGKTKPPFTPPWSPPWITSSMRDITKHPIIVLRNEKGAKELELKVEQAKLQPTIEEVIELTEDDFLEETDK